MAQEWRVLNMELYGVSWTKSPLQDQHRTLDSRCESKQSDSDGIKQRQSVSRLAPEGAPRPCASTQEAELRVALEESSQRRAELVQRLREAHGHLDAQTDLLKDKDSQLQHSQSSTQLLELKHKQLAEAVSALEKEKEAAELSRFEESRRRAELQDKVLQLEMDLLKMRSALERGTLTQPQRLLAQAQLSASSPVSQDDFCGEKQAEKEVKKLKEALTEAEERAQSLEVERDQTLQQLCSSNEAQLTMFRELEEMKQRLNTSVQDQTELQDQLSDSHSRLGQLDLEKDLLSTKAQRLEDSLEDLKAKLAAALADKDRLIQEKADMHQRVQALELQLHRAQRGKEGFNEQMCQLQHELDQTKTQASQQQRDMMLMTEELLSVKQQNEKLTSDMATVTQKLEVTLKQLHELEAEKLIHTNQIAALETERSQLIGEREELLDTIGLEELTELRNQCRLLRKSQSALHRDNQKLQAHCQSLEEKMLLRGAELHTKEEELQHARTKLEQEREELTRVADHWHERWMDAAMKLRSMQAQEEEAKQKQQKASHEEVEELPGVVESLQKELHKSRDEIQTLIGQKVNLETELDRLKREGGAVGSVEMDTCMRELELEGNRSQSLLQRYRGNTVTLGDMDGELMQVKAELQNVWDMLRTREAELEEQQQELQSVRDQVSQQSSEVQRLGQQLTVREQELKEKEYALRNLESLRDSEKVETEKKILALRQEPYLCLELARQKAPETEERQENTGEEKCAQGSQSQESRGTAEQMEPVSQQSPQTLNTVRQLQQKKTRSGPFPESQKEGTVRSDSIDPEQQRRLVTEQLKSLFKEREQLRSPGAQRRAGVVQDWAPKSKLNKSQNALDTPSSQKGSQQEKEAEPRAVDRAETGGKIEEVPGPPERLELQENDTGLIQGQNSQNVQMTAMNMKMETLKERNENLMKAAKLKFEQHIQPLRTSVPHSEEKSSAHAVLSLSECADRGEGGSVDRKSALCEVDGMFLATQVEVLDSEVEDEEDA
ncbi:MAR-binding filament-like protein 1-1 [Chanos chanos]|uniref:MAR-binding filament-like protein 1-1 n=1 Tax=Chanos chanos TaxID=29144 RepID=A0A6J2ULH9_CHACN|nr:MAR-binding filament-like protein 1-1 [Chanos chanos]